MKKKVLAIALAVALLAVVVGGSLAWFTDSDEATNTFTVGSIEIVQHEKEYNENNELVDFSQNKVLMPIVKVGDPANDDNYEDKIVTIENVGNNPAYVRSHIAIPKALNGYLALDGMTDDWQFVFHTEIQIGDIDYVVYSYNYTKMLEKGATTEELLKGVYLYAEVDLQKNEATGNLEFCKKNSEGQLEFSGFVVQDANGTTYPVNVYVATQAVQAEGFEDGTSALDSAFGKIIPAFTA